MLETAQAQREIIKIAHATGYGHLPVSTFMSYMNDWWNSLAKSERDNMTTDYAIVSLKDYITNNR